MVLAGRDGATGKKGKAARPSPPDVRLVSAWPDIVPPGAVRLLCPWLAGLEPVVGFWLGALGWHDANAALLRALAHPGPPSDGLFAGVFGVDPFRTPADLFAALRRAGIGGVVNLPSVSVFDGEVGELLGRFSLGVERELAFLARARDAGFRIAGCAATPAAAAAMTRLGSVVIVAHGGPGLPDRSAAVAAQICGQIGSATPVVPLCAAL